MSTSPSGTEELIRQLLRHHIAKKLSLARIRTLAELLSQLAHVSESGDGWSARCSTRNEKKQLHRSTTSPGTKNSSF